MDKKLKYYDLMEDLRKQIVSGKIKPGTWTWNVLFGDGETHG